MTRLIFNIVLLLASVMVVFVYIKPTYEDPEAGIVTLQNRKEVLLEARSQLDTLKKKQSELIARRNTFSEEEIRNLDRIVPQEMNPVLFIMELDTIARSYGMSIKNIKFEEEKKTGIETPSELAKKKAYETFTVTFDVTGSYQNFSTFLTLVEQSLRIVDVSSVSVTANEVTDIYQYTVKVHTYWIKK